MASGSSFAKRFWYDDFIALKKYFSTETLQAYMNNFIFTEDVANRRFTHSMLDLVKGNYNEMVNEVLNGLQAFLPSMHPLHMVKEPVVFSSNPFTCMLCNF